MDKQEKGGEKDPKILTWATGWIPLTNAYKKRTGREMEKEEFDLRYQIL